jgi:hypothetical protein
MERTTAFEVLTGLTKHSPELLPWLVRKNVWMGPTPVATPSKKQATPVGFLPAGHAFITAQKPLKATLVQLLLADTYSKEEDAGGPGGPGGPAAPGGPGGPLGIPPIICRVLWPYVVPRGESKRMSPAAKRILRWSYDRSVFRSWKLVPVFL